MPSGSHGSSASFSSHGSATGHTSIPRGQRAMNYNSSRFIYRPHYYFLFGHYYRTTPKAMSRVTGFIIAFIFGLFISLFVFLGGNAEKWDIESEYRRYQKMISNAEINESLQIEATVEEYFNSVQEENLSYDAWAYYYKFSNKLPYGWTFYLYSYDELLEKYPIGSTIILASEDSINNLTIDTDSIPMDFKNVRLEDMPPYQNALNSKKVTSIISLVILGIDFLILLIGLSFLIPKKTTEENYNKFKEAKKNNFENKEAKEKGKTGNPNVIFEDNEETVYCDYCGKKIKKNTERCPFCGSKLL